LLKAILFDVEGTLIDINIDLFMRNYVGLLAPRFAHLLPPDKFSKYLLKSYEHAKQENHPQQTNMQSLYEDLCKSTGQSMQTLHPIFQEFHESDFPTLKCLVKAVPQGAESVEYALQKGYLIGVAINPCLPLEAMRECLRWAGLKPELFKVIPTLDGFHFFKPQREYYQELVEKLALQPENCLLVSRQPQSLIPALRLYCSRRVKREK